MKKGLVVANWKMNPQSVAEAQRLLRATKLVASRSKIQVVVCPPAPFLSLLSSSMRSGKLALGAQDLSALDGGSHTGEISAAMLRSVKVSYVIVGHSERRALGEKNDAVAAKLRRALSDDLTPILCVGEHERDKEGEYLEELRTQIKESLKGIHLTDLKYLAIAYEPVWAIGRTAAFALPPNELVQTTLFVRKVLSELYNNATALSVPILYGGSVERDNAAQLAESGAVSGALVGHASLKPEEFSIIVKAFDH